MQIANKYFYERYRNFSGSFPEWFNACVDEHDVFRFWYKGDPEDMDADFVQLVGVIDINNDYLLELKSVDWRENDEGKEMISFVRLSEVREFVIFATEEDKE